MAKYVCFFGCIQWNDKYKRFIAIDPFELYHSDKELFYSFSTWICNTGNSINRTMAFYFHFFFDVGVGPFAFVSKENWNLFFAYYLAKKNTLRYQGKRKKVYKGTKIHVHEHVWKDIFKLYYYLNIIELALALKQLNNKKMLMSHDKPVK